MIFILKVNSLTINISIFLMRPTFMFNNQPVRAGGILFYHHNKESDQYDLLMIHSRGKYEDFGGQTDEVDNDYLDTVSREVEEESNNIIPKDYIKNKIQNIEPIYIKHCKYILYCVESDAYYDPAIFGDHEKTDDINRTVEWVSYDDFKSEDFKKKLNFRLTAYNVLNYLENLCT